MAITYTTGADAAASVVKEIERAGRKAIAIQADATDANAVEAAVENTVATFGRLDVLVNNAGTAIPKRFESPWPWLKRVRGMSGRDFLNAMLRGELPPPPICHLVDFTFDRIDDGRVEMVLTPQESQYNPIGSVQGGIIATVLDSVMGCAVHTKLPVGRAYTTLEIKVNYLRGVSRETGPMTAVGRVIHLGGRTAMAEASLSDASGKLFA